MLSVKHIVVAVALACIVVFAHDEKPHEYQPKHHCIHDKLIRETKVKPLVTTQAYKDHPFDRNNKNKGSAFSMSLLFLVHHIVFFTC